MRQVARFTTSWDDGHPLDMRVAELLHKHGLQGTFYVPGRVAPGGCCNPEGFAVLGKEPLRQIAREFEIGAHTLDHKSLTTLPAAEARHQIEAGKRWLEDQLGASVAGFCYPNGHHDATVRNMVKAAGFTYGRTTEDLCDEIGTDPFQMPVTMHFHPRRRVDIARLFVREERRRLREGRWLRRLPVFAAAVAKGDFEARFRFMIDRTCARGGTFHIWGHSWEIERIGGWTMLDNLLGYAAQQLPRDAPVTNGALVAAQRQPAQGTQGGRMQAAASGLARIQIVAGGLVHTLADAPYVAPLLI